MTTISHVMATSVQLGTTSAVQSMQALTQAVKGATAGWKAQEAQLNSSGDKLGAVEAKYNGLGDTMAKLQDKINLLKQRQAELDTSTDQGKLSFEKYGTQLARAERQYASLDGQQQRTKKSLDYYQSGLAGLQGSYKAIASSSQAYVERLQAEGKNQQAQQEQLKTYKSSIENLNSQLKIQESELEKVAIAQGKDSDAYRIQKERVDKTATSLSKAKTSMGDLNAEISKGNPSFFDKLKSKITGVKDESDKTHTSLMDIAKGSAVGGLIANGISNLGSSLWETAKAGFQMDMAGDKIKKQWSNLHLPTKEVNDLVNQISDIRGKSNASGASINQLQKSFYNLTNGNVGKTKALTNEIFAFGKQAGLSGDQISGMGQKFMRVFNASKVNLTSFNKAFASMPGLKQAIISASGMTQDAFSKALTAGKISGTKMQEYMMTASKQSGKAWDSFGNTTAGKLAKVQGTFANLKSSLMKPIETSALDGLNSVVKSLEDKKGGLNETGKQIQTIAKSLAKNVGSGIVNTLKFISEHPKGIVETGKAVLILMATFKTFTGVMKLFGLISKTSFGPWGLAIGIIAAIIAGVGTLYATCKPFRNFVNSLGSAIGKAFSGLPKILRNVGKWFSKTFNGIIKFFKNNWKQVALLLVNPIAGGIALAYKHFKPFHNFVNGIIKWFKDLGKNISNWFSSFISGFKKIWNKGWNAVRDFLSDTTKNMFKGVNSFGSSVSNWLKGFGRAFNSTWRDIWSSVGSFFGSIWRGIKRTASNGVNGVLRIINALIDAVDKVWHFFTGHSTSIRHLRAVHFAQGGIVHRHLSVVNDGVGSQWKELMVLPDGTPAMSNKRNAKLMLPDGTRIYNGKQTKAIMNSMGIEHYANGGIVGGIKSFIGGAWDKAKAVGEWLAKPAKFVGNLVHNVMSKIGSSLGGFGSLASGILSKLTSGIVKFFKKGLKAVSDSIEGASGGTPNGGNIDIATLRKGANIDNVNPSNAFLHQLAAVMMSESGGNANASNNWDVNAGSNHSVGALQYTRSTWNAYARSGHANRGSILDNAVSFFNNSDWQNSIGYVTYPVWGGRYKWDWRHNGPRGSRRYANGGIVSDEQLALIGEGNKSETIIPWDLSKRSRAYQLMDETLKQFKGDDGTKQDNSTLGKITLLLTTLVELQSNSTVEDKLGAILSSLVSGSNDQSYNISKQSVITKIVQLILPEMVRQSQMQKLRGGIV